MEDVLEVYHREFDEDTVLVCMDETSKQQTKETRTPRPVRPGQPAIVDFEYERNGVANLFIVFAPLLGWRWVKVTDRRTRHDWAHLLRELVDDIFPGKKIVLVMDNLNIHSLASLYEAFEPAEARRIAECLEIHYTPKHGSWLNLAEIEIGVMARQLPGTAHSRPRATLPRNRRPAGEAQSRKRIRRLALQDRGCSHQAEVAVSVNPMMAEH